MSSRSMTRWATVPLLVALAAATALAAGVTFAVLDDVDFPVIDP